MTWQDKYDKVNSTFDGQVAVFGNHYSLEEAKTICNQEEYDDESEINKFVDVEYVWLRFGFLTNDDGELDRGWKILDEKPKSIRGCIKATMLITQVEKEVLQEMKRKVTSNE